jgi:peptidyl-prolyl cis-trans isomerase C
VLDDLIDQELLAQAAIQAGFTLDETSLQERIDQLIEQLGSQQVLEQWMSANYYTDQTFHLAFARELQAARMRDQIIADVPTEAAQVHVRQILLYDQDSANDVYAQLQAGGDFDTLVAQYDAVTYGELGWFPRGYLLDQKLEEVAFSLQPGEYSTVIQTSAGYHIIQVIESDSERLLEPDALWTLQQRALAEWIQEQRSISQIEIMLP